MFTASNMGQTASNNSIPFQYKEDPINWGQVGNDVLNLATQLPGLSTLRAGVEAATGRDFITNKYIDQGDAFVGFLGSTAMDAMDAMDAMSVVGAGLEARAGTAMGETMVRSEAGAVMRSPMRSIAAETTPSQFARSLQGSGNYPGVDVFRDITLKKGTIIYGGYPGQSAFYTTSSAISRVGDSASELFQGLQVGRNPLGTMGGYRGYGRATIHLVKIAQNAPDLGFGHPGSCRRLVVVGQFLCELFARCLGTALGARAIAQGEAVNPVF